MSPLLSVAAVGALVVRAVANLAEKVEDPQAGEDAELREWHMAAAEAVGVNAAIRMLTVCADQTGVSVDLPRRIDLDHRPVGEVRSWLATAAGQVEAARGTLAKVTAAAEWKRVVDSLPASTATDSSVAEALIRCQELMGARREPRSHDRSGHAQRAERILARLDPDARDDDREAILRLAAFLATSSSGDASLYLSTMGLRVREANIRSADRRQAAQWLEALERPEIVEDAAHAHPEHLAAVRSLQDVVAGTAVLTPELATAARIALDRAISLTASRYRREVVTELLAEHGFTASQQSTGNLRVERGSWQGEYAADVWVDANLGVNFQLLRLSGAVGDDAELQAAARAAELREHITDIAHEMSHRGIAGAVAHSHRTQHAEGLATTVDQTMTLKARRRNR